MEIDKSVIIKGLKKLGLPKDSVVLTHSSLSSFGYVKGGAKTVIDAIIETVGDKGTVMMPTLTGNEYLSKDNPPFFDTDESKCWTGAIPEEFRHYPQVRRSLHPTHSVAVFGPLTDYLIRDHFFSITPCDNLSPYGKLAKLENGFVLLLGVDHESNTMIHHIEEIAGVEYHLQSDLVSATVVDKGSKKNITLMIHQYGIPREFNRMELLLSERGIQSELKIGNAIVKLVKANNMVDLIYKCVIANRKILLKRQ